MGRRLSKDEWNNDFIKLRTFIHGNKYNYDKSICINSTDKIIINCPIENHGDFLQSYQKHINARQGCPKCGDLRIAKSHKKSQDEFIKQAQFIHNYKYIYNKTQYTGSQNIVTITCLVNNHGDFDQIANDHINKRKPSGCPKCKNIKTGNRRRANFNIVLHNANFIHKEKYDYSEFIYTNNKTKSIIICPEHGRFNLSMEKHILRQQGCSKCAPASYGEKIIIDLLTNLNYNFEKEYHLYLNSSIYPKRVDFYVKSLNLFIEFNGKQHYEIVRFSGQSEESAINNFNKQQVRDKELKKYCENNNINLLEINITKCNYNKGGNLTILQNYINKELLLCLFKLKSKLYLTRNKVD